MLRTSSEVGSHWSRVSLTLCTTLSLPFSYGDVIVVVGMNPNKKYLVSPEQRATLIRRMLEPHGVAKHVRVKGTTSDPAIIC